MLALCQCLCQHNSLTPNHRVYQLMEKPAFVFDEQLILDHQALVDIGFQVEAVGKVVMATKKATPTNNSH